MTPTNRLRVLIACEYSGRVRQAFRDCGHDAWSCDLMPAEDGSLYHMQRDVLSLLGGRTWADDRVNGGKPAPWDLLIAHPPCTHLAVSGARWFKDKVTEQAEALDFVRELFAAPIPPEVYQHLEAFVVAHHMPQEKRRRKRSDWSAQEES
jgi:hypothetical protein